MDYITILIIVITITLIIFGVIMSEEFDYSYNFWGIVTFTFFGLIAYVGYLMLA